MQSRVLLVLMLLGTIFKNTSAKERVLNGATADILSYPFMVQVTRRTSIIQCGGTIISEYYVLSAAHCTGPSMTVSVNSTTWDGHDQIKYDIDEVIIHEQFNAQTLQNDIALLKIQGQFIFTSRVKPIKLATNADDNKICNGAIGLLIGWGSIRNQDPEERPGLLKDTYAHIIPKEECGSQFPNYPNEMCTKIHEEVVNIITTGCVGDGGGPLLVLECKFGQGRVANPEGRDLVELEIVTPAGCKEKIFPKWSQSPDKMLHQQPHFPGMMFPKRPQFPEMMFSDWSKSPDTMLPKRPQFPRVIFPKRPQFPEMQTGIRSKSCETGQTLVISPSLTTNGQIGICIIRCKNKGTTPNPVQPTSINPEPPKRPGWPTISLFPPTVPPDPPIDPGQEEHPYTTTAPGEPPDSPIDPGQEEHPYTTTAPGVTPSFPEGRCTYLQVGVIAIHFSDYCLDPNYPYDLYPQISNFRTWISEKTGV